MIVRDRQVDGSGDRGGIATVLGADAVQQRASGSSYQEMGKITDECKALLQVH